MVAACVPAATTLLIMNFQGHILGVANSVGPPVIAQIPNSPAPTNNQRWQPIPLLSGNYDFIASLGNKPPFFLSYAGAANGSPALFAQAVADGGFSNFGIDCINNTAGYIIEPTSGAALTGWPAESGSTITPVRCHQRLKADEPDLGNVE